MGLISCRTSVFLFIFQTGDVSWTYTQAAGIITVVFVYEDLLFCASFDKLIRCYTREVILIITLTVTDDSFLTPEERMTFKFPFNHHKWYLTFPGSYACWINTYLNNQFLSSQKLRIWFPTMMRIVKQITTMQCTEPI